MNLTEVVREIRNRQAQIDAQVSELQAKIVALQQERGDIAKDLGQMVAFLKTQGITA